LIPTRVYGQCPQICIGLIAADGEGELVGFAVSVIQ
jgi:hypothetical protein